MLSSALIRELLIRLLDLVAQLHDSDICFGVITPKDIRIELSGERIEMVEVEGIGLVGAFMDLGLAATLNRIWASWLPLDVAAGSSISADLYSLGCLLSSILAKSDTSPDADLLQSVANQAARHGFSSAKEMQNAVSQVTTRPRLVTPRHFGVFTPTAAVAPPRTSPNLISPVRHLEDGEPTQEITVEAADFIQRDIEFGEPTQQIEISSYEDLSFDDADADWIDDDFEALDFERSVLVLQETPHQTEAFDGDLDEPLPVPNYPAHIGHYRVIKVLGQGAFSTVYQAHHEAMDRMVAIKLLTATDDTVPDIDRMRARMVREAKLAGRLGAGVHVPIHDLGFHEGNPYMVMAFVDGVNLHDFLRAHGAVSERQAARFVIPILIGLSEVHMLGIVHRDIKPANLILTRDPRGNNVVRILDFGIAIEFEREMDAATPTRVGEFVGSVQYAAPEQFVGESGPQSDIYSLGMTLYEMVHRARLCPVRDFDACLLAHTSPTPWEVPGVSDGFGDILHRAIAKYRGDRYESAAAMLEDIQVWLKDPTIRFLAFEPI
jgi:serine/threonine protein kinase